MGHKVIRLGLGLSFVCGAAASQALTLQFGNLLTGNQPVGSNFATLNIIDSGIDSVQLTLTHNNTSASGQFLSKLLLNIASMPSSLTNTFSAPISSINVSSNGFNDAGSRYDVEIDFFTNSGNRLESGQSVSWTMSGVGLDSSDFNALSSPNGNNQGQLALLHIQGIAGGGSGKLTPVPEPATMIALGTGALALLRRRRSAI